MKQHSNGAEASNEKRQIKHLVQRQTSPILSKTKFTTIEK